jgi:predicted AAA+ superfamily ATPase
MEHLLEISNRLIEVIEKKFVRSLYYSINWRNRLIEIKGARGVGKTTLMLQKAADLVKNGKNVLYITLDNAYFYENRLLDLCDYFYKYGGDYLFIDEVHKYPQKIKGLDWSRELKNIYDSYPDLNVVYSGSSILQLYKGSGDLSRRKSSYYLPGLSFREYLEFNNIAKFPIYDAEDIFNKHKEISKEIIKNLKILPHFADYLKFGYYPFYNEAKDRYYERINEIINITLETDIPAISEINYETIMRLKKMLSVLANSVPYTPNLRKLAEQLNIVDYRTLIRYLNFLEKAELIQTLSTKQTGDRILKKPDKIFLQNPNLMHSIAQNNINKGTLRETFFINQMMANYKVNYPKSGDFIIENKYTVEVGGKGKTSKQVAGIKDAFVALDDIETGFANKIPLWLFGFTY